MDSNPNFVVIGDLNHDNNLDLIVITSGYNGITVYLGYGNASFEKSTTYSTGYRSLPKSMTIADFNNDRNLDVAVANYGTNNIGIFLGYGNGSFMHQKTYTAGSSRPLSIVTGDMNNDDQSDLIVANYGTHSIGVFLGFGDGSFGKQRLFSTDYDSFPQSICIGDFNDDQNLDIAVANYGTDNVGIFFGYGNGSFEKQMSFSTNAQSHPYSLAVGDFNNDHYLDIAVANYGTNNIGLLFGYGNGTFSKQKTFSTGTNSGSFSIVTIDLNNDNILDIVINNYKQNSISVFLGDISGNFSNQMTYPTKTGPCSLALADFNNDNRLDLIVVTNGTGFLNIFLGYYPVAFQTKYFSVSSRLFNPTVVISADLNNDNKSDIVIGNSLEFEILIYLGYGNGTFGLKAKYFAGMGSLSYSIAVGDLNHDNYQDIVVANSLASNIVIFLGFGDGTFTISNNYTTGIGSVPYSVVLTDLNNDNRLDIIVSNSNLDNIGIFFALGNGTFGDQKTYSTGNGTRPQAVIVDDFNNDNILDIVVANYASSSLGIFLGLGNGTYLAQRKYTTGINPNSIASGYFNNDAWKDIVVACPYDRIVQIFFGQKDGSFVSKSIYEVPPLTYDKPQYIVTGDFNNDKALDVAFTTLAGLVYVIIGNNNGSFQQNPKPVSKVSKAPTTMPFTTDDFNNDNLLDLVVVSYSSFQIGVVLSHDYGYFTNYELYSTGSATSPFSLLTNDFNNDTYLDIAVANSGSDNIEILFGDGNVTFRNKTTYSTGSGSQPHSVITDDFNNDKQMDIVVVNSGSDNICILFGYANGSFGNQKTFSTGSYSNPQSTAAGDFNYDNWLDLVVANSGTDNIALFLTYDSAPFLNENIYTSMFNLTPNSVAMSDFNKDNQLDIVTANYQDNIGIFFGYGNGSFSHPVIYSTGFDSNPQFVGVADLNNDNQVDIIVANTFTNNIGIFFGYKNGTFSNQTSYSTDECIGPFSFVVNDFNNDTRLDISVLTYTTGCIYTFFGNGDGTFPTSNYISIDSQSKSISSGDFNNDHYLDFVIANFNKGTIDLYFGYGNGTFTKRDNGYDVNDNPRYIAVGDLNNDTWLDVAFAAGSYITNHVGILFGSAFGNLSSLQRYYTGSDSEVYSVIIVDLNNDNRLDIVFSTVGRRSVTVWPLPSLLGYNSIGIFVGKGDGSFLDQTMYSTGSFSGPFSAVVGDFNNDKRLDVVVTDFIQKNICILFGYQYVTFEAMATYSTGENSTPRSVTVANLNNDKLLDIVVANSAIDNICLFYGYRNGSFIKGEVYSTGSNSKPYSVAIGDFNDDNQSDIVVANYNSDNIMIFVRQLDGTFVVSGIYSTGDSSAPYSIIVAYLNEDKWLDIAVANYGANYVVVFLGQVNGTFINKKYSLDFGSRPTSIIVGDFNRDTLLDIATTNYGTSSIGFLMRVC
ncbi:unnamed protein product [Adineta ricciae]|nr:unnamed protein product [Adineta ricciae]